MNIPEIDQKEAAWGFTGIGIPAEVFFHTELTKTAKMLFGLLRNVSQTSRGCWASNRWLSQFLQVSPRIISEAVSDLAKFGFIKIVTVRKQGHTNETERRIYIDLTYQLKYRKMVEDINKSMSIPVEENNYPRSEKLLRGEKKTSTNDVSYNVTDSKDSLCKASLHSEKKTSEIRFIPSAEKLAKIIRTKKNIKITPAKINNWSLHLHKLHNLDGVSIRDIDKALNYLSEHWMDKYCPHIESGQTFREKYLKLVNQMDKPNKTESKQSEPVKEKKLKFYNHPNDWVDPKNYTKFEN